MSVEENISVARAVYDAFNTKDFARLEELARDDCEFVETPFEQTMRGKRSLRDAFESWARVFPDAQIEIRSLTGTEDRVVVEAIGRGTQRGTLATPAGEIAPTGNRAEVAFCDVLEIADGKVARGRSYLDVHTIIRKLAPEKARLAA